MIVLEGASRWYGEVIGLNDVTTTIAGGVTALLGQNGAGKTTLIRMITGQLRPTTGKLEVFGEPPFANPNVMRRLGYCPDIDNFYERMTARQFIVYVAELSGLKPQAARDRTATLVKRIGMDAYADRAIGGYSKGMRQRVKLAQAMVAEPEIILLDEPLNGLDPVARREYIEQLYEFADEGRTIIVSSHILYEVESMTKSILLLHRGRLLAEGDLRVVRSLIDRHPHRVRVESSKPRLLAEALVPLPNVLSATIDEREGFVELEIREPDVFYDRLAELALAGLPVLAFTSPDNNLEAVFSYLVTN